MTDPKGFRELAQAGKDHDPAWYRIHRRLSIHITAALLRTSVKLDHITYTMIFMALLAAALLLSPSLWLNALGVAAGYASFLLDKVDGEVARVRRQQSVRGILLDRFHHRLVEPLVFLALGVRAWQATDSTVPVIAALATMLAANIIEETQQLPPFIAAKHARESRSWPVSRRVPTAAVERVAAVFRSLKTFRMYLTVLPLVMLALLAEAWTGRPVTTAYLLVSAVALWTYTLFQAWYYVNGQLDAEITALTRRLPPLPEPETLPAEPRVAAAPASPAVSTEPATAPATAPAPGRTGSAGAAAIGALLLALVSESAAAATFYVDKLHPSASPSGPGTESQPYSTIGAAVSARAAPGNTILVKPAVYREQVSISGSGTSGAPIVLRATAPGVVVDGADDFSNPALWALDEGSVYVASSVNWSPKQVIVDGVLLTATTEPVETMPVNTFRQVAGEGLCVNLGGGNPGHSQTFVGRRNSSFTIAARSWIVLDGFQLTRADDRAISIMSGAADIEIVNNTATFAVKYGVYVSDSRRVRIANNKTFDNSHHGLMLTVGANECIVEDNESYRNALPGQRAANGLYMYGASNNVIRRNKWHDNQDSGQHMQSGSNDNVCYNNISWNNGDHGFDHLGASGTLHLNDVAFGNANDGLSLEGGATGTRLLNCISVNNGLFSGHYDLWVDALSLPGFQSNDNIIWNSTAQPPIRIGAISYAALPPYVAATGQDTRSVQADPLFVSPATGDFRLQPDSPGIDSGNSDEPQWPLTDRDGLPRLDAPGISNTGTGPVAWSDRGAHEFHIAGLPPVGALTATPPSGASPLNVLLDASGSTDPDGAIVSYRFEFGDGTSVGPQTSPMTSHIYTAGTFQASVTVTDNLGLTDTLSVPITVSGAPDQPPVVSAPATGTVAENALLTIGVTASDPDGQAITSLTADLSSLPAGHNAVFTPGPGNTAGTLTWTPSFTSAGSHTVRFFAANLLSDSVSTLITVTNTDRAPVVTAPATVTMPAGLQGTVGVSVSDPDGNPITSLTANLSGLPAGHSAVFTPGPGNTTGVLTWTPVLAQQGAYSVTFTGSNGMSGQDTTQIIVTQMNLPPNASLAGMPPAGSAPLSVTLSGAASSDPEGGTLSYRFDFGDGAVLGPQAQAVVSHIYAAGTFTATLTVTDPMGASDTSTIEIAVAPSTIGPNLVKNSSFETGLAGWASYQGGEMTRVAGGHEGAWCVRVVSTAGNLSPFGINDSPTWVTNAGSIGTRYRFSAWVRSDAFAGTAKLQIREYQGALKLGATTYSIPVQLSPEWRFVTVDHVTLGQGTMLDFQIYESPVVLNDVFFVDEVSIRVIPGAGQPDGIQNESPLKAGKDSGPVFGARLVPSVSQGNATLHFTTTRRGSVQVELFDATGRRVRTLVDDPDLAPGPHTQQFDGRNDRGDRLDSGVYFYRVRSVERSAVGRLVLTR